LCGWILRLKSGERFLRPEGEKMRKKRKKAGANVSKIKYMEGWVEFTGKKNAKKAEEKGCDMETVFVGLDPVNLM